jgi:hypothetical protein
VFNKELYADGLLAGLKYVRKECYLDLKKTRGKNLNVEDVGAYVRLGASMFDESDNHRIFSYDSDDDDDRVEEINDSELENEKF